MDEIGGKITRIFKIFVIACVSLFLLVQIAESQPSDQGEWRSSYSGQVIPRTVVARTQAEWQNLWKMAGQVQPEYSFDPSSEMVVGIFLGVRRTGGYAIEITRAEERDGRFVIDYIVDEPSPGEFVTQALTTPSLIKIFPRTDLEVVFERRQG